MKRKIEAVALAMIVAGGCATVPPDTEPDFPIHGGEGSCESSRASGLVGRTATTELGADALRLTGGNGLRWIQPGQAVTMDYRPGRVNIELDARNRVVRITCG